jgi:hypothetical protein
MLRGGCKVGAWDVYQDRIESRGSTKRGAALQREKRQLLTKLPDNLSYQTVTIFNSEYGYNIESQEMASKAVSKEVVIINSDNLNEKYIYSMPDDDIGHGDLVCWMGNHWLVTERDANTTAYTRAKMIQCNYLLKWVSDNNTICEQWCMIEDGTKYLTGEYEDRNFVVVRGDSRIAMTIARNNMTVKFGRENRFLIDDPESSLMLAYTLSKPFKLGSTYNNKGVYKFVLQEVNTTDDDNQQLCIADYYKHFPKQTSQASSGQDTSQTSQGNDSTTTIDSSSSNTGRKVWL